MRSHRKNPPTPTISTITTRKPTISSAERAFCALRRGERKVGAGELLFFPRGEEGAHKLTNTSERENLVYIDFDVVHEVDITEYPDSGKLGIWGMGINKLYPKAADVDYYEGE